MRVLSTVLSLQKSLFRLISSKNSILPGRNHASMCYYIHYSWKKDKFDQVRRNQCSQEYTLSGGTNSIHIEAYFHQIYRNDVLIQIINYVHVSFQYTQLLSTNISLKKKSKGKNIWILKWFENKTTLSTFLQIPDAALIGLIHLQF